MDVRSNWYPTRHVDPNEPGLVAAYTFADNELAQFGRYLNRASTGAAYDLNSRQGTPGISRSGGLEGGNGLVARAWRGAPIPSAMSYDLQADYPTVITAANATLEQDFQHRIVYSNVLGWTSVVFDGATYTTYGNNTTGRGPVFWSCEYDTATLAQSLYMNGNLVAGPANVVRVVPAAFIQVGNARDTELVRVYSATRGVARIRASYIRDFASKVLWQWTPRDVGEGPAGGILTGSYSGVGGWTCPLGAATMSFVQRGDRLTLTDTQAVNLNRIDFEFANRPWFGSFLVEYEVRNPATDSMVVGFTPMRGVDPTAAASGSYWLHVRQVAGPWWRSSVYLANGAQIDAADTPTLPVAGDRGKVLFSRDVDGTIQVWSYLQSTNGWWWSTATGTDVTVLPEACITVAPRGAYVERVTWFQGAASPHELGIQVP